MKSAFFFFAFFSSFFYLMVHPHRFVLHYNHYLTLQWLVNCHLCQYSMHVQLLWLIISQTHSDLSVKLRKCRKSSRVWPCPLKRALKLTPSTLQLTLNRWYPEEKWCGVKSECSLWLMMMMMINIITVAVVFFLCQHTMWSSVCRVSQVI